MQVLQRPVESVEAITNTGRKLALLKEDLRIMVNLMSAATATPNHLFSTTELVASLMHKLSPELINTICSLGVDQRYSVMANYPEFLEGAAIKPTNSTTGLGVDATKRCVEEWGGDPFYSSIIRHTTLQGDWSSDVFSSEIMRRHTRLQGDWSSDVCSSDLAALFLRANLFRRGWVDTAARGHR